MKFDLSSNSFLYSASGTRNTDFFSRKKYFLRIKPKNENYNIKQKQKKLVKLQRGPFCTILLFLAHCTGIELGGSSHMMLSMQYLNPRRPYKKPNFPKSSINSRDRRFSGTFIPEHHVITMPPSLSSSKVKIINM